MIIQDYFKQAWNLYTQITPQAKTIENLLRCEGEPIVNDHVAYRTFDHEKVNMQKLAEYFLENGYKVKGEYQFEIKKLDAIHLEHPQQHPKIFISQLRYTELPKELSEICENLIASVNANVTSLDLLLMGRAWEITYSDYQKLAAESEYAAWCAAIGLLPNHFTISVNALKRYKPLPVLNDFLKEHGFIFNTVGGEIKGSQEVKLEQSSTVADRQKIQFSDGEYEIPTCYYEFAHRYKQKNGRLFHGFIESSADKIFESTYEN